MSLIVSRLNNNINIKRLLSSVLKIQEEMRIVLKMMRTPVWIVLSSLLILITTISSLFLILFILIIILFDVQAYQLVDLHRSTLVDYLSMELIQLHESIRVP